jgi:hypothetical protein
VIAAAMKQWHTACLAVIKPMARKCSNAMLQGKCTDTSGQEHPSVSFLVSSLLAMVHRKSRMPSHLDWSSTEEVWWVKVNLVHIARTSLGADIQNLFEWRGVARLKTWGKTCKCYLTESIPLHDQRVFCDSMICVFFWFRCSSVFTSLNNLILVQYSDLVAGSSC